MESEENISSFELCTVHTRVHRSTFYALYVLQKATEARFAPSRSGASKEGEGGGGALAKVQVCVTCTQVDR